MFNKKSTTGAILLLSLMLVLSACGASATNNAGTADNTASNAAETTNTATENTKTPEAAELKVTTFNPGKKASSVYLPT